VSSRKFPHESPPTGWFQVAWSVDLAPGEVVPLRYFGRDLVLYRGESGEAHVFDAFCPHLGAHMGYGGTVAGDDLVCPFHAWRWDCQGCNVDIPYSTRVNRSQRVRVWPVQERNGLVMVWHDVSGAEPSWEPPVLPEYADTDNYAAYPECRRLWPASRLYPQFITENSVDAAHQKYVHGAAAVSDIEAFESDGPRFWVRHRMVFGAGKKSTWLTPDGQVRQCADFAPFVHYSEYRGMAPTPCTRCWYACRGETEAPLGIKRIIELNT